MARAETRTFRGLDANVLGYARDEGKVLIIVDTNGFAAASVDAQLESGAWTTAKLRVKRLNAADIKTPADYATPIEITSSATMTALFALESQFIAIWVDTIEGGTSYLTVNVHLRDGPTVTV